MKDLSALNKELDANKDALERAYLKKGIRHILVDVLLLAVFLTASLTTHGTTNQVVFFVNMSIMFTYTIYSYHRMGKERRKLIAQYLELDMAYLETFADWLIERNRRIYDEKVDKAIKEQEQTIRSRGLN